MALNIWTVYIMRYGAGTLKCNKNKLQKKTEIPENSWQWIKNCAPEVMWHGSMFLRKMVE